MGRRGRHVDRSRIVVAPGRPSSAGAESHAMNAPQLSRLPPWWFHGAHPVDRAWPVIARQTPGTVAPGATRKGLIGAVAARSWRWARRQLERLTAPPGPRNVQEVLAYANSIEHLLPNMATELRFMASRDPDPPQ